MTLLLQGLSVFFLMLYTYVTLPSSPDNFIWCLLAVVLLFFANFRKPYEAWGLAALVLLGYGGYALYLHVSGGLGSFGWNEVIWLAIFPYAALVGGVRRYGALSVPYDKQLSMYQQLYADDGNIDKAMFTVEERHNFIVGTAFIYKLEEEVIRALRERREFTLLVVEIERFRPYAEFFGYEYAQSLLDQVASYIAQAAGPAETKAHLGEGLFAVLLPNEETEDGVTDRAAQFKSQLDELFTEMMLIRPRRESQIKLRMKYSQAICPADGIEARHLLDKAQGELEGNETGK